MASNNPAMAYTGGNSNEVLVHLGRLEQMNATQCEELQEELLAILRAAPQALS